MDKLVTNKRSSTTVIASALTTTTPKFLLSELAMDVTKTWLKELLKQAEEATASLVTTIQKTLRLKLLILWEKHQIQLSKIATSKWDKSPLTLEKCIETKPSDAAPWCLQLTLHPSLATSNQNSIQKQNLPSTRNGRTKISKNLLLLMTLCSNFVLKLWLIRQVLQPHKR